jgi:hypothetical protein
VSGKASAAKPAPSVPPPAPQETYIPGYGIPLLPRPAAFGPIPVQPGVPVVNPRAGSGRPGQPGFDFRGQHYELEWVDNKAVWWNPATKRSLNEEHPDLRR